ncbi:MAG: NAD(P)H-binding protein [Deltaproteobacteria bacterium]|nr:NAD(P)H-binding protein [Deltaproteobacteria bacterium]
MCLTTLGVGESRGNPKFFWKYLMFGILLRFVFRDHGVQETVLQMQRSTLDWVIVRPAAFSDEPATGKYHHGFSPVEKKLTLKIPRADMANFMLQQLSSNQYLRQCPGLSN